MGEGSAKVLQGKRVVVTRAVEQSETLVEALRERGAVPVVLPMVAFGPPDDPAKLQETIRELGTYDWVFLTSQNALRALEEPAAALGVDLRKALSRVRIAAVGPATAQAVENAGLRLSYVAAKHHGTALAGELAAQVSGRRVLLPRSDRANPELVRELKSHGADVFEVCAYRTIRAEGTESDMAKKLAREGAEAVLFFSPSAAGHLHELLGKEGWRELSERSVFAAIGPVTEEALRRVDVNRVVVARDTSVRAILDALEEHFANAKSGVSAGVKPG